MASELINKKMAELTELAILENERGLASILFAIRGTETLGSDAMDIMAEHVSDFVQQAIHGLRQSRHDKHAKKN